MLPFIIILFILLAIYSYMDSKENFEVPPSYKVNIPDNIVKRTDAPGTSKPSLLPGGLLAGPYEQIARNNPLPYNDPALQKTNRARILKLLDDVKGFLSFEAQEIEDKSDPTIQLPLGTLRGDFGRLESEVNVLQRNPGLQPDMTELQIAEIEDNLAFLQRQVRLIGVNRPFGDYEWDKIAISGYEGFTDTSNSTVTSTTTNPNNLATLQQLKDFSYRIQGEVLRLRASGTTNPVNLQRSANLTQMKGNIDEVIRKLEDGSMLPSEVPILSDDIKTALPILGNPTSPLPTLLKELSLPAGLANLLPSNIKNDMNATRKINELVDKYAEDFFKGTTASVNFNVKYISPREVEVAKGKQVEDDGFPTKEQLDNASGSPYLIPTGTYQKPGSGFPDKLANPAGGAPLKTYEDKGEVIIGNFDWKERARQIEEQVRRRGLNTTDFGILPAGSKVSSDFSWRGYTKMICNRLKATPDPGLPESCGCPADNWQGWNL